MSACIFLLLLPWGLLQAARAPQPPLVVTPIMEAAWGEKARTEFFADHPLADDGNLAYRMNDIGRRIARLSDRPDLEYTFSVIRGPKLQAYSFPGGTICLTEPLARLYDDDQLAFVLGHEIAHVALRHQIAQLRLHNLLDAGTPGEKALLDVVKGSLDRDAEMEADRFGALYAVRASYRYSASYESLERLAAASAKIEDDSHPDFAVRVEALRKFRTELDGSLEAFQRGVSELKAGDADAAIRHLSLFVAQFPNSVSGRVDLGAAYLARVRRSAGTPDDLAETLPILPDPGVTVRGPSDQIDLDLARTHFEKALGLNAGNGLARAGLALAVLRMNDRAEARRQLEQARSASPDSPELLLCSGNVEYLDGRYADALAYYSSALALRSDWAPALRNLALTYGKLSDLARACAAWKELAKDPPSASLATKRMLDLRCGAAHD